MFKKNKKIIIILLPIITLFIIANTFVNFTKKYYHIKVVANDPSHLEFKNYIVKSFEAELLKYKKKLNPQNKIYNFQELHLFIKDKNIKKLTNNLPLSGEKYIKAHIKLNNSFHEIKLKNKGDVAQHWAGDKISCKIKTQNKFIPYQLGIN